MLVLTYHRIGNADSTLYDPGVFSTTQEGLARQLDVLKRTHTLVGIDEAAEILSSRKPPKGSVALITFDDGYRDNLTEAVPVLEAAKAPAVFFLVTDFLDGTAIPWWDSIAYLVKQARKPAFTLRLPHGPVTVQVQPDVRRAIAEVLRLFRLNSGSRHDEFIAELEDACECQAPTVDRSLMMSWAEAQSLRKSGVIAGGHTVSHPILSNVSLKQQEFEIAESRRRLETNLGYPVLSFAYPVGYRGAFSADTKELVRNAGYQFAFSYYGGAVKLGKVDPLDVTRVGVAGEDIKLFRLQAATYPYLSIMRLDKRFRSAA